MAPTAKVAWALAAAAAVPASLCQAATGAAAQAEQPWRSWLQHRRLSTTGLVPQACLEACPGLQGVMSAKMADFVELSVKYPQTEDVQDPALMAQMMEEVMLLSFSTVCEFQEEFKCFADNAGVCDTGSEDPSVESSSASSSSSSSPFAFGVSHMECVCSACPGLQASYPKLQALSMEAMMTAFSSAFSGNASSEPAPTAEESDAKLLQDFCPLSSSLACVSTNLAQCEGLFANDGLAPMDPFVQDIVANDAAAAAFKQRCDAGVVNTSVEVGGNEGVANENDVASNDNTTKNGLTSDSVGFNATGGFNASVEVGASDNVANGDVNDVAGDENVTTNDLANDSAGSNTAGDLTDGSTRVVWAPLTLVVAAAVVAFA